jgi:putative N6-adenine-specific DNA methylase
LNTSGVKLSDRGYRKMPVKAPLREMLAAAIVMAAGYDGSQNLVLPMCGSGTLAVEAALIATGRAPGLLRPNFGFKHLKAFDENIWKTVRGEARKKIRKSIDKRIIATDIAPEAIEASKQNAKTAGVDHLIEFKVCDFADTPLPEEENIIIMNPEYGQRLGETAELEELYKRIGDYLKQKCAGSTAYIFTGNKELAVKIGLKASRKFPFYNGNIECRLLKYELYKGSRK